MKKSLGTFLLASCLLCVSGQTLTLTAPTFGTSVKEYDPLTVTWTSTGIAAGDPIIVELWWQRTGLPDSQYQATTSATNDGSETWSLCSHGAGSSYYIYLTHEASGTTAQGPNFSLVEGTFDATLAFNPSEPKYEDTTSVNLDLQTSLGPATPWKVELLNDVIQPATLNRVKEGLTFPTSWTFDSSEWTGIKAWNSPTHFFRFSESTCGRVLQSSKFVVSVADDPATVCGDGVKDPDEGCDDGGSNSDTEPNACRVSCVPAGCGDAVIDSGEQCDNGSSNSFFTPNACRGDCTNPRCGDGVVDTGEVCDGGSCSGDCSRLIEGGALASSWAGTYKIDESCDAGSCCCMAGIATVTQNDLEVTISTTSVRGQCGGLSTIKISFQLTAFSSETASFEFGGEPFIATRETDGIFVRNLNSPQCSGRGAECSNETCTDDLLSLAPYLIAGGVALGVCFMGATFYWTRRRAVSKLEQYKGQEQDPQPQVVIIQQSRGSTTSRTSSRGGRGNSTHRRSGSRHRRTSGSKRASNASRSKASKKRAGSSGFSVQTDSGGGASEFLTRVPSSSSMPSRV